MSWCSSLQVGKLAGRDVGNLRGHSPPVSRPSVSKGIRSRSRSPRKAVDSFAPLVNRNQGEDLRWNSSRNNGRRDDQDRQSGIGEDLRRNDTAYRRRQAVHAGRDPSVMRRGERSRARDGEQGGRDPDLRARGSSWPGSTEVQDRVRRQQLATAEKNLLDLTYEEYLAVFGQVQDEWRKRKLELTFIKSQLPSGPG